MGENMKRLQVVFLGGALGAVLGLWVSSAIAQIEASRGAIPNDDKAIAKIANTEENAREPETTDGSAIYKLNEEAKCTKSKSDKRIYCTNNDGKPITGSVIKTYNGIIIRQYVLQNGLLNGVSKVYDNYGHLKETRTYVDSVLHGDFLEYNKEGDVIASTPYVKGKKEGISTYTTDNVVTKTAFENNQAKEMVLFDIAQQKPLYRFQIQNDKIQSGSYTYLKCVDTDDKCEAKEYIIKNHSFPYRECIQENCKTEYVTEDISAKGIDSLNAGRVVLHEKMSYLPVPFKG